MAVMLCQAKGDTAGQCPHGCASLPGGGHEASVFKEQGVVGLWTFFSLVAGEIIRSPHHPPSGSNRSGVFVLVGGRQLTSTTW